MNILILSGGSGNDSLVRGIKTLYPKAEISVLVNAYDAGKSTGVCRKVTDTLGVSDIRKNHIRMYEATTEYPDKCILEFYNNRYDFTPSREAAEIQQKLREWNLTQFEDFVKSFFDRPEAANYQYTDFNVSNIVYASMYESIGYKRTNKIFCNLLGIPDFLILNSFDNVYIQAVTESGKVIEDEGDIVEYCNAEDIITKIEYVGDVSHKLNPDAISAIAKADMIVISTGTFWSSIYPTLQYGDLYQYINQSSAKKLWALNNECDKDSYGVGSVQFAKFFTQLGLDLSDFTILLNEDAVHVLKQPIEGCKNVIVPMGNDKRGKHNPQLYAKNILRNYYGIESINDYSTVLFDFDDTLWARDADTNNVEALRTSIENVLSVSKLDNVAIISGNEYESIKRKLTLVFGSELSGFTTPVWADVNSRCYVAGKRVRQIDEFMISKQEAGAIAEWFYSTLGIPLIETPDVDMYSNLKLKPLSPLERRVLTHYLNDYVFPKLGCSHCKAVETGKTTMDIIHKDNNKVEVLKYEDFGNRTLYIGDEINGGNDDKISSACSVAVHTQDVYETKCLLELLM